MSRIGKMSVIIPDGVKVEVNESHIRVTGKLGFLERDLPTDLNVTVEEKKILCTPKSSNVSKKVNAYWGLTRTLIQNLVVGVSSSFSRLLAVEGVGYRASVDGSALTLNVGYSDPVTFLLPQGVSAEVSKDNVITLKGIDKTLVGLTAARIRALRPIEPYKGKGIRYVDEHIVRKAGKTGGKK